MLKKVKKVWSKLLTQLTEKGQLVWELWDSMRIFQSKGLSFNGLQQTSINNIIFSRIKSKAVEATTKLSESRGEAPDVHGSDRRNSHLWLLLLMPVAVLYVVVLPLVLSRIVLTYTRTKLSQVTTRLKINS